MAYGPWTTVALALGSGVTAVALWLAVRRWHRSESKKYRRVATITGLFIYPIKSCKGISLSAAEVQKRGFRNDRRWLVVDTSVEAEGGQFMTQRQLPKMALIETALVEQEDGTASLRLCAPNMEPITVPKAASGPVRRIRVWRMWGEARDCGPEVAEWLAKFLDKEGLRLVHMTDDVQGRKMVECSKWGDVAKVGDEVGMADFAPFLLANEKSMAELKSRLLAERSGDPVTMERFRPNIVVAAEDGAFAEDDWRQLSIEGVPFRVVKPCDRCTMTTVNPRTGVKDDNEPLDTLRTFRMDKSNPRLAGPLFGVNLVADGLGRLALGDSVLTLA